MIFLIFFFSSDVSALKKNSLNHLIKKSGLIIVIEVQNIELLLFVPVYMIFLIFFFSSDVSALKKNSLNHLIKKSGLIIVIEVQNIELLLFVPVYMIFLIFFFSSDVSALQGWIRNRIFPEEQKSSVSISINYQDIIHVFQISL